MTGTHLDKVAEAICGASTAGRMFPWDTLAEGERDAWRRMAEAAIDALGLKSEKERGGKCVCRHGDIDHDMYGDGRCHANMVTRHSPCPCKSFQRQRRTRLVSPWVVQQERNQP